MRSSGFGQVHRTFGRTCSVYFGRMFGRTVRLRSYTTEDHICQFCPSVKFANIKIKEKHIQKRHFKCTECEKVFNHHSKMSQHVREEHKKCDVCHNMFEDTTKIEEHYEKNHFCKYCSEEIPTMEAKSRHEVYFHKCSYCGKSFAKFEKLNHIRTFHQGTLVQCSNLYIHI